MITLFVSHTEADAISAEDIRIGLEARGYQTWREPSSLTMDALLYPSTIENVLLSSAAIVLLWSVAAAQSEQVERHISFTQQLKKQLVLVLLDETPLTTTLIPTSTVKLQGSCLDIIPQLLPLLPAVQTTNSLIMVSQKAAHPHLHERRAAIEQAVEMLQRGEESEAVLAILQYLAHIDPMTTIREKAQAVLDAQNNQVPSSHAQSHIDSRHRIEIRCRNGHISYFDKRVVCAITTPISRGQDKQEDKNLDELHLTCTTNGCGVKVIAYVDCENYR